MNYRIVCFLISFLWLSPLTISANSQKAEDKPTVLVNISPYAYFVKAIAHSLVNTEIIIPPNTNPHVYEPTPKQIKKLTLAKLWFRLGDPTEQKILPFLREKNIQDVDLSEGITLIKDPSQHCNHSHEGSDRHLWLDPILAKQQAKKIKQTLLVLLPANTKQIEENYTLLAKELDDLHKEISTKLSPLHGSYLLISHPSLGYYCERYKLHQLSIEIDGKDPKPKQIIKIVDAAIKNHIPMILIQPQYNNKGALLIAKKLNIPIYEIDPYTEKYIECMKTITKLITENHVH
jgi:zinc transport system substrate-binding protein